MMLTTRVGGASASTATTTNSGGASTNKGSRPAAGAPPQPAPTRSPPPRVGHKSAIDSSTTGAAPARLADSGLSSHRAPQSRAVNAADEPTAFNNALTGYQPEGSKQRQKAGGAHLLSLLYTGPFSADGAATRLGTSTQKRSDTLPQHTAQSVQSLHRYNRVGTLHSNDAVDGSVAAQTRPASNTILFPAENHVLLSDRNGVLPDSSRPLPPGYAILSEAGLKQPDARSRGLSTLAPSSTASSLAPSSTASTTSSVTQASPAQSPLKVLNFPVAPQTACVVQHHSFASDPRGRDTQTTAVVNSGNASIRSGKSPAPSAFVMRTHAAREFARIPYGTGPQIRLQPCAARVVDEPHGAPGAHGHQATFQSGAHLSALGSSYRGWDTASVSVDASSKRSLVSNASVVRRTPLLSSGKPRNPPSRSPTSPGSLSVSKSLSSAQHKQQPLGGTTTTTTVSRIFEPHIRRQQQPQEKQTSSSQNAQSLIPNDNNTVIKSSHPKMSPHRSPTSPCHLLDSYHPPNSLLPHTMGAKELLFARLHAKVLNPSRIVKDASSQKGALCISPKSQQAYKITRVLQSAIYGGVFEAEVFSIPKVLKASSNTKPEPCQTRVALKILLRDLELQHRNSLQEDITAELQFESAMKGHKNVLSYEELWESQRKGIIYVVMPFAEFEDLFEVLKKRSAPFSEGEARWIFRQLLDGAKFLHSRGIGFRDHSLENVLMFRNGDGRTIIPKITDPGQAVRLKFDNHGRVLELKAEKLFGKSFRPPEVYRDPKMYNPVKVDVFCLGWMLFFALTKRQPFDRTLDSDPHWRLIREGRMPDLARVKGNTRLTAEAMNLLQLMMLPDYRKRPDPRECLQHPWFKQPDCCIDDQTVQGPPLPQQVSH